MTTEKTPNTKTRDDRIADVQAATDQLPAALKAAIADGSEASWEAVEQLGAIIHRRARLLAGKKRGG